MLELDHVTKLYGTVLGVNDLDVSLPAGAYGLLGPNGSGKTTLINLITGQFRPTIGHVRVLGEDPFNSARLYRVLGVCPAAETLYLNLSAHEWVTYLLRLHGFSSREAAARATQSLERAGLGEAMHRVMKGYSRGMRQRTKVAQAIAHDPQVLVLDEPFNGLDPVGRHDLSSMLREWSSEGKLLILASHVLHEVEAITSSFLLISQGRLLAAGSSEEMQTLLADVPDEIYVSCSRAVPLAQRIFEDEAADAVRFDDQLGALIVTTRSPLRILEQLPVWAAQFDTEIHELRSAHDSLDALFRALVRKRRGERR